MPIFLVVDDIKSMREIVVKSIRREFPGLGPNDILEALNGVEALARLGELAPGVVPDLILTDWKMPGMDGLTLIKKLKDEPRFREIPIILTTVESRREMVMDAINAGITDYISKPFSPKLLREKINQVLKRIEKM